MKSNRWYRLQVAKLYAIIKGENDKISKMYLEEKVGRILGEIPIGEHPSVKPYVANLYYNDTESYSLEAEDAGGFFVFKNKQLQDLEDLNLENR